MARVSIQMGAMSDTIAEQLKNQGLEVEHSPKFSTDRWQRMADSITYLRIHGILTHRESDAASKRVVKEIADRVQPALQGATNGQN